MAGLSKAINTDLHITGLANENVIYSCLEAPPLFTQWGVYDVPEIRALISLLTKSQHRPLNYR